MKEGLIKGAAHITGGGLLENIPRVLPAGLGVAIDVSSWERPPVFSWLAQTGGVDDAEMLRTFNCGIGMVLVVAREHAAPVATALTAAGETVFTVGTVEERNLDDAAVRTV